MQAKLASQVDGVIEEILVQEGSFVSQGQPLLRINAREQDLRVKFSEENARKAANDLESARRLLADNLISRNEFERMQIEKSAAEINLQLAKLQQQYHTPTAPFSGHVLRIHKKPGEAVQRFEQIAEIANFHDIIVLVYLDAANLPKVHAGQPVIVEPLLENHPPRSGKVEFVDPVVDPGTGIFRVKIALTHLPDSPPVITGIRAKVDFLSAP